MPSAGKLNASKKSSLKTSRSEAFFQGWKPYVMIILTGFLIYGKTINDTYTYLDDHTLILQRMDQLKKFDGAAKVFNEDAFHSAGKGFYYRPMLTLSFMADAFAGRGKFEMFHFTNIAIHIICTMLVFFLFVLLGYKRGWSLMFSFLFLVHPTMLQSVAWVPGRNDSILALFVFSSLIFFIRNAATERTGDQIFHLLFFILALFTKETAIALPFVALLYLFISGKIKTGNLIIYLVLWIGIIFSWLVIRYNALGGSSGFSTKDSLIAVFQNLPALLAYLGRFFIPVRLSVLPVMQDLTFHMVVGGIGLAVLAVLYFTSKSRRTVYFLFGFAWFLAFLLPSFVQQLGKPANFSDHRGYLSVFGLLIILAETDLFKKIKSWLIPVGVIILFAVLNLFYADTFSNKLKFWNNAAKTSPGSAFNLNNLGAMYFLENDLDNAELYFRKAVDVNPLEPMANGNLGLVLMNRNMFAEAEKYYQKEISVNPGYDNVYFNLGVLYYRSGLKNECLPLFEHTIKINQNYADAYRFLVNVYLEKGDTVMAATWLKKATEKSINVYE